MSEFKVTQLYHSDPRAMADVAELLASEGLRLDANLEYTAGIYDDTTLIATGSIFQNSLRCFAINKNYQGHALLNTLLTHLVEKQYERNHFHIFIYTKPSSAHYFEQLGFYTIATIPDQISFLENIPTGFSTYVNQLISESNSNNTGIQGAIVMNANPFTLGHQYLVTEAAKQCDQLHLFVVTEDSSLFPYAIRKQLIIEGTRHIPNITYHDCGPYMISSSTFPAYFQKDESAVVKSQATLDVTLFTRIAESLGITKRFVGTEPFSATTGIYNEVMANVLQAHHIDLTILDRKEIDGNAISASAVRQAIHDDNWDVVKQYTPSTTYNWLQSEASKTVIDRIKKAKDIIHH